MGIGAIVVLVALIGAFLTLRHQAAAPDVSAPSGTPGTGNAAVGANGETSIVTYSDTGFAPKNLTVTPGTTVTWSNQSAQKLQVEGPNMHGTVLGTGGSYSHTFTDRGSYPYSNQERSTDTGTITVTDDAPTPGTINPNALPE